MTHLSQLSLALLLAAGCTDGGVMSAGGEDASVVDPSGCVIDSSRDPASAVPLVPENTSPQVCPFETLAWCGGKVDGQLCPRGDVDWYALTVPTGAELLDMTVGY